MSPALLCCCGVTFVETAVAGLQNSRSFCERERRGQNWSERSGGASVETARETLACEAPAFRTRGSRLRRLIM